MTVTELIRSRGLNIRQVAQAAKVSRPTIYALDNPVYRPSTQIVAAVAKAIGCKPGDIRPELRETGEEE